MTSRNVQKKREIEREHFTKDSFRTLSSPQLAAAATVVTQFRNNNFFFSSSHKQLIIHVEKSIAFTIYVYSMKESRANVKNDSFENKEEEKSKLKKLA